MNIVDGQAGAYHRRPGNPRPDRRKRRSGRLLGKATVTLYEDVQEFWVAEQEPDGLIAGAGPCTCCGKT